MAQLIPVFLSTSSIFSEKVELNSELIELRFAWNVRNGSVHLDFTDAEGSTLHGIKVVPNWPLLRQRKGSINFDGDLVVIADDSLVGSEITYTNFGNGQNLYYLTPAEMTEWEEAYGSR